MVVRQVTAAAQHQLCLELMRTGTEQRGDEIKPDRAAGAEQERLSRRGRLSCARWGK